MFRTLARVLLTPGVSDLISASVFTVAGFVGAELEPSHGELWMTLGFGCAAALLGTGILLLMPFRVTAAVACMVHVLILAACALGLLASIFLFVTIMFLGLAVILGPGFVFLALNSGFSLGRSIQLARRRADGVS